MVDLGSGTDKTTYRTTTGKTAGMAPKDDGDTRIDSYEGRSMAAAMAVKGKRGR